MKIGKLYEVEKDFDVAKRLWLDHEWNWKGERPETGTIFLFLGEIPAGPDTLDQKYILILDKVWYVHPRSVLDRCVVEIKPRR